MSRANSIVLFAALSAFACLSEAQTQPDWAQVVAAAKKEGKVILYSNAVPAVNEKLKADFQKANPGITLEFQRLIGSALTSKLQQERQTGAEGGEVVLTSEIAWASEAAKSGLLRAPIGPAARAWPAEYLIAKASPILGVQPFPIVYNTNLVKAPITGYQDLLRPDLKGKVGTTELAGSVSVIAWYDWLEKTQGEQYLPRLAEQGRFRYVGAVPATQAVSSGEIAVTAFSAMAVVQPLLDRGAPIKAVVPTPSFGNYYAAGVVNWARRPNAALVVLDFMMSLPGQSVLCGRGEMACPLAGVPGSLDIKSIVLFDPGKYNAEAIKAFEVKWNRVFKPQ